MKHEGVYIIAEAGVNHNGELHLAKELVVKAKEIGADAIKFQTFRAENIVTKTADRADYQKENCGGEESQFEMIKKLELSEDEFKELFSFCKEIGIDFLSSPFDLSSIEFLSELGLKRYKIPSGEITNLPYLRAISNVSDEVILSTGMATPGEIKKAIEILKPAKKESLIILHATTEYPCPYDEVNLKAMITIRDSFGFSIGYSDHTQGIEIPVAAVSLGATVIEKHFTLDNEMLGPDHKASLNVEDFKKMVRAIRNVESSFGDGIKKPTKSEKKNISIVRKSIVANGEIKKGEILTEENLTTKRPGNGLNPMENWDNLIGTPAERDYKADELI